MFHNINQFMGVNVYQLAYMCFDAIKQVCNLYKYDEIYFYNKTRDT